jgi:ABC-type multidrug transport system ATPase subunit
VEQVADHVAMIDHGRIALNAPLADIRQQHGSLEAAFIVLVGRAAAPAAKS